MAKLILSLDGQVVREYGISKERMTIGRKPHNDIQIDNLAVSGEHAMIMTILNDSFLEDLGSTNGTLVNGQPVKKHFLQAEDVIEVGKYQLKYVSTEVPQTNEAEFEKTMVMRAPPAGVQAAAQAAAPAGSTQTGVKTSAGVATTAGVKTAAGVKTTAGVAAQTELETTTVSGAVAGAALNKDGKPATPQGAPAKVQAVPTQAVPAQTAQAQAAPPQAEPAKAQAATAQAAPAQTAPAQAAPAQVQAATAQAVPAQAAPAQTPAVSADTGGAIQILSGPNAGRELALSKALTTLGKPGVQVAVIAKRPQGFFITHVEGTNFTVVNGKPLDAQAQKLQDHDVIELAGVKMAFYLKG
jgi:pSer/pThr/pTyr-binding forkhead associated (FHA) protein